MHFIFPNLLSGADLPGLQSPGMVPVWENRKVVLWGGSIVWSRRGDTMKKNNHLYELIYSRSRGKVTFDVTKYAVPGTLAPSKEGLPPTEQKGSIPDGKDQSHISFFFLLLKLHFVDCTIIQNIYHKTQEQYCCIALEEGVYHI